MPAIDWDRTRREVLTLEWIDGSPLSDPRPPGGAGHDLPHARPRVDPVLPAPRLARRLLPRRHASGQSVRRCGRPHRRGRFRHHGAARPQGAALSGRNPLRLHPARLPARRRGPFRGRLCAARPSRRGFRAGDPRHRRADPFAHRRPDLHGEAADALVRDHRAVRHEDAHRTCAACKRPWWSSKAWRARSTRS